MKSLIIYELKILLHYFSVQIYSNEKFKSN
jgi:hypothetical protein